jgi:DNA polymerase III epsilon subunit-like protein
MASLTLWREENPSLTRYCPILFEFLGEFDTILLAHNALFDVGFLAMALTRLGIACPPHYVFDTLDMMHRLYPTWPSHSLENVAIRLKVTSGAAHRALSDANDSDHDASRPRIRLTLLCRGQIPAFVMAGCRRGA